MFFIFGMPRSGTTLLAQCLSSHSDIVVPHETDFIIPMTFIIDRVTDENIGRGLVHQLIIHSSAFTKSLGEFIGEQTVHDAVYSSTYQASVILEALYARLAEAAHKKLAGDKSPNDLNFLRVLVKTGALSPGMKIIHVVRDIRDVMLSINKTGWVSDLNAYFPRFWCNSNLYLRSLYKASPDYALVKYEDLVSRPQEEITRLWHFLGFAFQAEMLAPEKRNPRYRGVEAHTNLYNPISRDSVGKYQYVLKDTLRRDYEMQAGEALTAFGYA